MKRLIITAVAVCLLSSLLAQEGDTQVDDSSTGGITDFSAIENPAADIEADISGVDMNLPAMSFPELATTSRRMESADIKAEKKERARLKLANEMRRRMAKMEAKERRQAREKLSKNMLNRVEKDMRKQVMRQWETAYELAPRYLREGQVDLPEGFRCVAEAVVPKNQKQRMNQRMELRWFRERGFNTVLMVWDGESPEETSRLARRLSRNWNVIFTHGPQEMGDVTVYANVRRLARAIEECAPYVDVVLPLWRLGSGSHWSLEEEPAKQVLTIGGLAQRSSDVPVFGELYMKIGEQEESISTAPAGVAGVVLQNVGHVQAMPEVMLRKAREITGVEPICPVVVGPKPYYDSYYRQDLSRQEVWTMKRAVADAYLRAGARGVIVLVGDGAGERKDNTGRLTRSRWHEMKTGDENSDE